MGYVLYEASEASSLVAGLLCMCGAMSLGKCIIMTSTFPHLSSIFAAATTMLRKFGKTVHEKLDRIESCFTSQDGAAAGQPGSHFSSRDGGGRLHPADFPTQADFFKFRKQRGVNLGALYTVPIR